MINRILAGCILLSLWSCSAARHAQNDEELDDGRYRYKQAGCSFRKVFVYTKDDSVSIFNNKEGSEEIKPAVDKDQIFVKSTFDIDAITIPFKYRPKTANLPQTLNAGFNGNFFVGYRVDRFRVSHEKTPVGIKRYQSRFGLAVGAFTGIGETEVNESTTDGGTTNEYHGFIFSRGFALILGFDKVTVGTALGFDRLSGRDRTTWIYQHKPWFGVTIGLDLN